MSDAPTYASALKYHELTDEQMKIECSGGVILALVQHMIGWRNIAPYLEVDDSVVDAMAVDEERKRRELLERWKVKFGHEATLERLARCFISAGKAALADLVCEERKKTLLPAAPAAAPQLTSVTPQLTSATPQLTSATPQLPTAAATSQLTSATPQLPTVAPKLTSATPQLTSAIPQLTSAIPQLTSATRQLTSTTSQLQVVRSSIDSAGVDSSFGPSVSPLTTSQLPAVSEERVTGVRESIDQFEEEFFEIQYDTEESLSEKACREPKFFGKFRAYLHNLPPSKRAVHTQFFSKHLDIIINAENIDKIFAILRSYCNYSNYELILHLVKKFCEAALKQRILAYRESFQSFEMATTIDVYLRAISARPELGKICEGFVRMAVIINKPPSECTLYEIRQLNEEIAKNSSVEPFSIYTACVTMNCVRVVLGIHPDCVGSVVMTMTPDFQQTHHLTEVSIDGRDITLCRNVQLHDASEKGDREEVISLISAGADVSYQDEDGWPALMWAARYGHTAVVQELVKSRATLDIQDENGWSALILAARWGYTAIVQELVKSGATLDIHNELDESALMMAARYGHTAVVQELVKSGATLDIQDELGESALILAASHGHTAVVQKLVKSGATLDIQNWTGDSAVMKATVKHHSDTLQELVRAGADLNLVNQEGLTVLMMAARSGRTELVDILLTGENINIDYQIDTGWSSLFFSAEAGHVATTQSLLRAGANPHLKDKDGLTVLDVATASERNEVCELLRNYLPSTSTTNTTSAASTASTSLRSGLPQVLINLANRSSQRVKQLFTELDRRLKSTDLKTEHKRLGVEGQVERDIILCKEEIDQ